MNLSKINEVIKASPAIQIQSKISLLQRRAWNVLLANAYNELPDKEVHRVSLTELVAKLGFGDGNQEYLKGVLRSIVDCKVEWNVLGKDKKEEWGVASLLAEVRISDGICFYQFPYTLRLKLHNPRVYAKLNLRLQNRFKSRYALVLWEICFDYFDSDRDQGETPFIPLESFRLLMGLEETEYPLFKELNRNVIKSSVNEINAVTDYHVEVEQKRLGRKIAELKFRITRVKELPIQESVFPDIENLPPVAVDLVQTGIDRTVAEKLAKQEWACVASEKLPAPGTYPDFADYVSEKIEMSLSVIDLKNRGGFIVKAIRENYQDTSVKEERQRRAEKSKEKALEDLTAEFRAKRAMLLRQAVHADPALINRAAARIKSHLVKERLEEHESVRVAYQKGGLIKAEIDGILAEEFCQDLIAPAIAAYEDEKARL